MSENHAVLRVEVKAQEKYPSRFKWEIYRGSEPMWIERAMLGYPTERAAYEAPRAHRDVKKICSPFARG